VNAYVPGIVRKWPSVTALLALLLVWTFATPAVDAVLRVFFPSADTLRYDRSPMWEFLAQHLVLVAVGGLLAVVIGVLGGLAVMTRVGRPFRDLVLRMANFGQAIPSIAFMAVLVPVVGYGTEPVVIALVLFSVLPVMVNVVAGIESVPAAVIEAGKGMGMTGAERLWHLQIPIALPVIMAGIRTMLVILVSAATLGAIVGAGGLGVPIMSGMGAFNNAVIAHGSVPAILLALIVDQAL
jgi:osmoprotectant transport system permease protein